MGRPMQPITKRNRRFIGWFLAARWGAAEVAELFDVDLLALQMAFDLA